MILADDLPISARRPQRRQRTIIAWGAPGVVVVALAVILVVSVSSRGGRAGSLVSGCEVGPEAQCPDADFAGANLTDVVSSGLLDPSAALPDGWSIIDGRLTPA